MCGPYKWIFLQTGGMEADSYRVSRVDNTWGFYRSTLSPKEETPEDHCLYDIRLIYWCFDTSVANA